FLTEIVLLLGHPFLQSKMRFDQEFRHGSFPLELPAARFFLMSSTLLQNYPCSYIEISSSAETIPHGRLDGTVRKRIGVSGLAVESCRR
ncbi:MAG: hypothetical protein ACREB8_12060, partial [Pseudolabrys sp.]